MVMMRVEMGSLRTRSPKAPDRTVLALPPPEPSESTRFCSSRSDRVGVASTSKPSTRRARPSRSIVKLMCGPGETAGGKGELQPDSLAVTRALARVLRRRMSLTFGGLLTRARLVAIREPMEPTAMLKSVDLLVGSIAS